MNRSDGGQSSIIAPIDMEIQKQIAQEILYFFDPANAHELRAKFGLPGQAAPDRFSVSDFFEWK